MRVVVQRVINSSVEVDGKIVGKSDKGLMLLVGFTEGDTSKEIDWMVDKVINLRIFEDENDVMNRSLLDINGNILSISQFTLYGDASKGRRPSYIKALGGDKATLLYVHRRIQARHISLVFFHFSFRAAFFQLQLPFLRFHHFQVFFDLCRILPFQPFLKLFHLHLQH